MNYLFFFSIFSIPFCTNEVAFQSHPVDLKLNCSFFCFEVTECCMSHQVYVSIPHTLCVKFFYARLISALSG